MPAERAKPILLTVSGGGDRWNAFKLARELGDEAPTTPPLKPTGAGDGGAEERARELGGGAPAKSLQGPAGARDGELGGKLEDGAADDGAGESLRPTDRLRRTRGLRTTATHELEGEGPS